MVSSGTDKSNEVIVEINQALKQHLRIFQFSENILAVVFLRIIKFYLFQVFKERNLLFVDRACNMNSLLISTVDSHMFEHSGMNTSSHATHCIE